MVGLTQTTIPGASEGVEVYRHLLNNQHGYGLVVLGGDDGCGGEVALKLSMVGCVVEGVEVGIPNDILCLVLLSLDTSHIHPTLLIQVVV